MRLEVTLTGYLVVLKLLDAVASPLLLTSLAGILADRLLHFSRVMSQHKSRLGGV